LEDGVEDRRRRVRRELRPHILHRALHVAGLEAVDEALRHHPRDLSDRGLFVGFELLLRKKGLLLFLPLGRLGELALGRDLERLLLEGGYLLPERGRPGAYIVEGLGGFFGAH